MKCKQCSAETNPGQFCPQCGLKNDEKKPRKPGFLLVFSLILAVALAVTYVFGKPFSCGALANEKYFKTPEDAIQHFVDGIARNDLDIALEACAIDDVAEHFDLVKFNKRMKAFLIRDFAPSEYEMYQDINRGLVLNRITTQIKVFVYSFLTDVDPYMTTAIKDEDPTPQFIKDADPGKLKNLQIDRMDIPEPDVFNGEINLKNMKEQAKPFGALEATERVVLYDLDGDKYLGGFYLFRYKKGWKIYTMTSYLAGLPADGSVSETSKKDYMSLIE